jgi:hypothetical protein
MLPVAEQAAAQEAFSLLREFGLSLGMPHAKQINKHSQKTPPQELALAERRLAEVLTGGIEDGR